MNKEQFQLILSPETIAQRISTLGQTITQDYKDKNLLAIGVLKGSFIFMADLVRAINKDLQMDFIRVSSYGSGTSSSGTIKLVSEPSAAIRGSHILLIEDIVDSGLTLQWLQRHFLDLGAASVKVCSLINKNERREQDVHIDYAGFEINQGFLIGYGLDYDELYRNLDGVYHVKTIE
ncbi:MAG: hypoxanthine phosphoribosyltransferase [Desulfobulbaceae bacterium]|uniref:Hypoxanthine phosphoribosyltransferase n=1 Tax=Candidatus Desulfatifera sulfidica TaxID=2841691 RepID=A0A8J6TCT8_9BACT|nr:hypoxanthine phosphoribosyltransferase [Candidatus Desulfatifera sulfidica]